MMSTWRRLAATAVLVAAIAGCGDSGESAAVAETTPQTQQLSRAEYIERVDEICRTTNATVRRWQSQWERALEQDDTPTNRANAARLIRRVGDELERGMTAIEALPAAPAYERQAAEYLHAMRQVVAALHRAVVVVERGDHHEGEVVGQQLTEAQVARDAAARAFGFRRCGQQDDGS